MDIAYPWPLAVRKLIAACGLPMVVVQQSAEARPTGDLAISISKHHDLRARAVERHLHVGFSGASPAIRMD
jgi:hypothetical protein